MRRIVTAALALLLAFSMLLMAAGTANASSTDPPGSGQNSVLTPQMAAGGTSAVFNNDGSTSWAPGVVGLLVCLADKTTGNVASPNAAYASGWTSSTVYATVSATVAQGQNGFFVYNTAAPSTGLAPSTSSTFNGDVSFIVIGTQTATGSLVAFGMSPPSTVINASLKNAGYYQINTTPALTTNVTSSYFTNTVGTSLSSFGPLATMTGKFDSSLQDESTSAAINTLNSTSSVAAGAIYTASGFSQLGPTLTE